MSICIFDPNVQHCCFYEQYVNRYIKEGKMFVKTTIYQTREDSILSIASLESPGLLF